MVQTKRFGRIRRRAWRYYVQDGSGRSAPRLGHHPCVRPVRIRPL